MKENILEELKYIKTINPVQLLIAAAGGFILFLIPNDANLLLNQPIREIYVGVIALICTIVILMMFKDYRLIGISLSICMILTVIDFIRMNIVWIIKNSSISNGFSLHISFYDGLCSGITWCIPFLVCLLVRIFSIAKWDMLEKRKNFRLFFYLSSSVFYVYFLIFILAGLVFSRPVDILGNRTFNMIPFINADSYWIGQDAFSYYIVNICFFAAIGFFFSVYKRDCSFIKRLLIFISPGILINLIILLFNTGPIGFDLIIISLTAGIIGSFINLFINKSRSFIIINEEKDIFDFSGQQEP